MTIARRYVEAIRRGSFFEAGEDEAEAHDYAVGHAVRQTRQAQIDGREWGPMSGQASRAVDAASRDADHFEADEKPSIAAETVILECADYGRHCVAAVVAHSIRRAQAGVPL